MTDNWPQTITDPLRNSQLMRVLLIGFLVLLLMIPIMMIGSVIGGREHYRDIAYAEVTSSWGGDQSISGPLIRVPYLHRWTEKRTSDNTVESIERTETRYATFLSNSLRITGASTSEVRYRGIFKVPLYTLTLDISGDFSRPDFSPWGTLEEDIYWDKAYLSFGVSDSKGITERAVLSWNNNELGFLPGSGESRGASSGIHVPLDGELEGDTFEYSFSLSLNGSDFLNFTPLGRETDITLTSDWPDPSFNGNWLPTHRTVHKNGFEARWSIPFLGRNYPQQWRTEDDVNSAIGTSQFGLRFLVPVDNYRMGHRSMQYAILFVVLTFITLWLFELLVGVRIHPLQYLLLGGGMCVFYLLELSLSEHIGFVPAYIIASAAVAILICAYSIVVLKSRTRAAVVGAIVALLYGHLYILLRVEDYALLIGSIGLFVVIATIMYLTRKIDWYGTKTLSDTSKDHESLTTN